MKLPEPTDTVVKRIRMVAQSKANHAALYEKDGEGTFQKWTYADLWRRVTELGLSLMEFGVTRGDHVGLMSDNCSSWIVTDLALLAIGAVDVPRGSDSTPEEISYILGHADCAVAFAEDNAQLEKILSQREKTPLLRRIVVFKQKDVSEESRDGIEVVHFSTLAARGAELAAAGTEAFDAEVEKGAADDLMTLLYTSGTTGEPKGVMLTHQSILFQIDRVRDILLLNDRDIFISVLPIWHSFERAVEYIVLERGAAIAYSKPIGKIMLDDMAQIRPTWMTSVPRIWEGVRAAVYRNAGKSSPVKRVLFHFFVRVGEASAGLKSMLLGLEPEFSPRSRVLDVALSVIPLILLAPFKALGDALVFNSLKAKLGGRFVAGVSGGGALPPYVDRFFQAAGIKLLEGYGLTETGPILAVRHQYHPVVGTVGPLLPDIQHRVLGEDMQVLPPGKKGVLYVKSPQVMEGYYKRPDQTDAVLQDGWLNTGDLVVFTHKGEFTILGRTKETIVLMGGENVEPTPIEETLVRSELIDQTMVVGQDQRFLGALIVPNDEKLDELAKELSVQYVDREELLETPMIQQRFSEEINRLVNAKTGFKPFERVFRFALLPRHFEVGRELTHTLKLRRAVVTDFYQEKINGIFQKR
jgi:long-chain acyl-CoA synthetase